MEEVAELRKTFTALDSNQCGKITLKDLRALLEERFDVPSSQMEAIFKAIDASNDETIHYTEFLAAMVSTSKTLQTNALKETFRRLDSDNKGYITRENFQEVFDDDAEVLTPKVKIAGLRQISFDDFEEYVCCSSKPCSPRKPAPTTTWI
jgi:Ca2+-binding EF-hand superfamily protein